MQFLFTNNNGLITQYLQLNASNFKSVEVNEEEKTD